MLYGSLSMQFMQRKIYDINYDINIDINLSQFTLYSNE